MSIKSVKKGVKNKSRRTVSWNKSWNETYGFKQKHSVVYGRFRDSSYKPTAREASGAGYVEEEELTSAQVASLKVRVCPPDPWDDTWAHNEKCWKRQRRSQYK
jgi:hypothetical protein